MAASQPEFQEITLKSRFSDRDRYAPRDDTYRPGPPRDSYRGRGPPPADSYIPSTSVRARARSRTPPLRGGGGDSYRRRSRTPPRDDRFTDSYRSRPRERSRSPPRRGYSPRREDDRYRARSPARGDSRYVPSPRRDRDRSPPPKRNSRDASLDRRDARSPPPKRERLASPPRGRYARYGMLHDNQAFDVLIESQPADHHPDAADRLNAATRTTATDRCLAHHGAMPIANSCQIVSAAALHLPLGPQIHNQAQHQGAPLLPYIQAE
jgi:hypothetical protein